jgi:hypothetical protein
MYEITLWGGMLLTASSWILAAHRSPDFSESSRVMKVGLGTVFGMVAGLAAMSSIWWTVAITGFSILILIGVLTQDQDGAAGTEPSDGETKPVVASTFIPAFGTSPTARPTPLAPHLAWVPPSRPAPATTSWHDDEEDEGELTGDVERVVPLSFEYADADGIVTERTIINWIDTRYYVKGLCLDRHAMRTFRKDRVLSWVSGEEMLRR